MTKTEFDVLTKKTNTSETIYSFELGDRSDRTLLYGYNHQGETCHLYLKGMWFYWHVYIDQGSKTISAACTEDFVSTYIPGKRIYPESSDYSFCALLKDRGYQLPFTTFYPVDFTSTFYGAEINEDFIYLTRICPLI